MATRHRDAHGIQQGACNIRAIARALVRAADEASIEGIQPSEDAAVRLIVHQLAHLTNQNNVNHDFDEVTMKPMWNILMDECEEKGVIDNDFKKTDQEGESAEPGESHHV